MEKALEKKVLDEALADMGIEDVSRTTIRQCSMLGSMLEERAGEKFSHLEFGVPGIPACPIGCK